MYRPAPPTARKGYRQSAGAPPTPDDARAYIRPLGRQQAPHTARKCYRQSAGAAHHANAFFFHECGRHVGGMPRSSLKGLETLQIGKRTRTKTPNRKHKQPKAKPKTKTQPKPNKETAPNSKGAEFPLYWNETSKNGNTLPMGLHYRRNLLAASDEVLVWEPFKGGSPVEARKASSLPS